MFNHQISQVIYQDRQRQIERQLIHRAAFRGSGIGRSHGAAQSIRRSIGRRVIQIGKAIAAEAPARTTRIGDPCGPIGELAARQ